MNQKNMKIAAAFALTLALTMGSSMSTIHALPLSEDSQTSIMSARATNAKALTDLKVGSKKIEYTTVPTQSDGMFHDGFLLAAKADGTMVFYNAQGKEAFTLADHIVPVSDFHNQRALVEDTSTNLSGYINTKGNLIIPCTYV
ncbi:WG repeat-containing protein [Paenibacillus wulumuqiensis]|uniref:WG repeat-containing protein n=1 Tax=Paenibacillus wulumuqiensis TaxID=1567107 RepID=UPI0006961485|nr:WG repeat-containing protein [Paenibacillus wulumuqiensis]